MGLSTHTAGKLNVDADTIFHHFQDKHEWMLDREVFNDILSLYQELNIDLFATRLNKMLGVYCSRKPDPGCAFVDEFSFDWSKFNFYASLPLPSEKFPDVFRKLLNSNSK